MVRTEKKISQQEADRQTSFMEMVRKRNDAFFAETGRHKKFYSLAMGCQMNAHDSEKLEGMLTRMGYEMTQEELEADLIIYNTCCVRENAELKVYGKLGALKAYKRTHPDVLICLCGCMMQQETVLQTLRSKYRHVDIVFGTFNLYKFPELLETRLECGETVYDIWQEHGEIVEDLPQIRHFHHKASVNIMFGCNNFCSYCIVPYVRGRERSRLPEDIVAEVQCLANDGVKEIMLLGQNVNSYGKTLEQPISFAKLLEMVHEVEGIERIRFMSSHPKDLSDELIETMARLPKVCKNLHLPVQSGSSSLLDKMNRHYTKEDYLHLVEKIRSAMPEITLSTDIMVGFPGETEEDFQETLDVVKKARYSTAFTFIYSKRTGTPAAVMENQVPEEVVKDRFSRLLETLDAVIYQENERFIGKTLPVLAEEVSKHDASILTGRTESNLLVHFQGDQGLIGQTVPVRLMENKTYYVLGKRVE